MDPTRQLIRWSIPGSVLLLTMATEEVIGAVAYRASTIGSRFISEFDPAAAVFVIALGVPIGFLMNQLYFYFWDGLAPWLRFLPVPLDRGKEILLNLRPPQLEALREETTIKFDLGDNPTTTSRRRVFGLGPKFGLIIFKPINNTVRGRKDYRTVRRNNWQAVLWILMHGLEEDAGALIRAEYGARADTYHALGGASYGVLTGTALFSIYNLARHTDLVVAYPSRAVVVGAIVGCGVTAVLGLLRRARASTLRTMQDLLKHSLRTAFQPKMESQRKTSAHPGTGG
jgi:hypothetical protein